MANKDRVKAATKRGRKRKFKGNQHTNKNLVVVEEEATVTSTTAAAEDAPAVQNKEKEPDAVPSTPKKTVTQKKVEDIITNTPKQSDLNITGYRLLDVEILSSVFAELPCPECKVNDLKIHEKMVDKKGLASLLFIKCSGRCGYEKEFRTSKQSGKFFDVNTRLVYAMRAIGQGYSSIEKFTALMNLPKPMTSNNYDKTVSSLLHATQEVAEQTMIDAANDLKDGSNDNVADVGISADGAWQRRGYSSLNGTYTVISLKTGKILDCEVMSRYCKCCKHHEKLKKSNPAKYQKWFRIHKKNCRINHVGSAGAMEVTGARRIFARSVQKRGLNYTEYLGDGDSKGFDVVSAEKPDSNLKKLECVGHVQKRVGTRLRNLKKMVKNLGGRGKLTNKLIDKLQNYYGIAVRSNVGNLQGMKKAIHASLFHVASSKTNVWHDHCPRGESSWCRYQADKVTGLETYKPGSGLPMDVIKQIKPIYNDLSRDDLLQKCLHGKTQNQNEAFNALIWERVPKATYVSLKHMQFGTYDAIAHFNIGRKSSCLIMEKLGMVPGRYMTKLCQNINQKRLYFSKQKSTEKARKRRKIIRGLKKANMDAIEETEGVVYEAGAF